ncbi:MAG TPA: tyrosine-type recombinase/integrase [Dehalococcoidia bacterium]|jgi:integrase|nr:tyrosine-type recombinase/integrase [Dehalococcoidia bacterium]
MNVELEAVAEFLTGNQMAAGSLPWRLLGSEDLRVVRRWAGEALPQPAERRLMRELRQAIREAESPEDVTLATMPRPGLLRAPKRRAEVAPVPTRPARLLLDASRDANDPTAARDCAVISLMLLAGLRRQEVIVLQRGDYDDLDGRVEVKSRRAGRRSVVLEGGCREDVERWLGRRGSGGGPLFLAFASTGEPLPRGLAASTVNRILARRCAEAGLSGLTPRALRGRFIWQLQAGTRQSGGQRCRYYLAEDGQPGWALSSLPAV